MGTFARRLLLLSGLGFILVALFGNLPTGLAIILGAVGVGQIVFSAGAG